MKTMLFSIICFFCCIASADSAELKLRMTLPSTEIVGDDCRATNGPPLTDLSRIRVRGYRFIDGDTLEFGNISVAGMEGDTLVIVFDIVKGSMGEMIVDAFDFSNNPSCTSSNVFAIPLDSIPFPGIGTIQTEYYDNIDFTTLFDALSDSVINKDWGTGPPLPGMGIDDFSIRWTGKFRAPTTGNYALWLNGIGSFRLYLTGSLFMQYSGGDYHNSGEIVGLTAGNDYDVILEYWSSTGEAREKMMWTLPSGITQVIPAISWQ